MTLSTKLTLLTLSSLLFVGCKSTAPTASPEEMNISKAYTVEGKTKDDIYTQVNIWTSQNYNSAKDVVQFSDKEAGVLVGNGRMDYPCDSGSWTCIGKGDWDLEYTMQVDIKDERFRVKFTNLEVSWPADYNMGVASPAGGYRVKTKEEFDNIRPILLKQGESIKASFDNHSSDDDW